MKLSHILRNRGVQPRLRLARSWLGAMVVLASLAATFPAMSTDCIPAPAGLIAWWPGDGHAEDLVGTNHGILMNGATFETGKVNQAFSLDGADDYVRIPNAPELNLGTQFTIDLWFFQRTSSSGELVDKTYGFEDGFAMFGGETLAFVRGQIPPWPCSGITNISLNIWHHAAVTYANDTLTFYLDGQLDSICTPFPPPTANNLDLFLGGGHGCCYFDGLIDEVSLYSRALSSNEVAAIYAAGSAGKCKGTPIITTASELPEAALGQAYSQQLSAVGGTPPYSYSLALGTVPPGLSLSTNGLVSGTPTSGGIFTFTVQVTDAATNSSQKEFLLRSFAVGTGNGLWGQYYNNSDFTALGLERIDATVDVYWGLGSPDPAIDGDTFSVRWTGKVEPRYSETYTFYTLVDDVVRLWVNGQLLIDAGPGEWSGTIALTAGQRYDIRMDYWENFGYAEAHLSWSSATQVKEIIPQSQLYAEIPPTITTQPQSQTNLVGDNVTFSVTASGVEPLSYQWRKDGTNLLDGGNINGGNTPSLTVSNVQASDVGNYDVMVTNSYGAVTSQVAVLNIAVCTPPPDGLIAWWSGDGHALDLIGANHGILMNGATYATGRVSQAFSFDGVDDFVSVPGTFGGGPEVTVEAWVKTRAVTGYFQEIVASGNYPVGEFVHLQLCDYGNIGVYTDGGGVVFLPVISPSPTGVYRHIALSVKPGDTRLYLDGNLVGSNPQTFSFIVPTTNLRIGSGYDGRFFNGDIDEVSIYNRALSSSEIAAIYLAGSVGKCKGHTPIITTASELPEAVLGQAYSQQLSAALGTPPYIYSLALSALPPGLSLSPDGLISGTPTSGGTFAFTVQVTDSATNSSQKDFSLQVSVCIPPPDGLVAWWPGEGDAQDLVGTNHGTLMNGATYATGKVAQAFSFDGADDYVSITTGAFNLPLGTSPRTVEAWVKTTTMGGLEDVFCYGAPGAAFLLGILDASIFVSNWNSGYTVPANVNDGVFHHVAVTYDGTNASVFCDGVLLDTRAFYVNTGSGAATIGARMDAATEFFNGIVDEVGVYNRALSDAEILALYNAGAAGKCVTPTPPVILTQPTNQVVTVSDDATFTVCAVGYSLSYQWQFNGTNLPGATTASLAFTNVQLADGGVYAVAVSNAAGGVVSSNATLTVNPLLPCVLPPSGLVAWWQGDTNALDYLGRHNGTLMNGCAVTSGKVGAAFSFDGVDDYVDLGSWTVGSTWTLEAWVRPSQAPLDGRRRNIIGSFSDCRDWGITMVNGEFGVVVRPPGGCTLTIGSGVLASPNRWYHLVGSCDGQTAAVYVDGQRRNSSAVDPNYAGTAAGLRIGGEVCCPGNNFPGLIDEVAIYDRALSSNEIAAIYATRCVGKCMITVIITQPQSQLAFWGRSVAFSVTANGELPLAYQWRVNGAPILDATNATLVLTNLQMTNAGTYTVVVTNLHGSVTSSPAYLTMNPAGVSIALYAGVTIDGVVDQTYGIQTTTNLSNTNSWVGVTNLTLTTPVEIWYDSQPATLSRRFYRVVPGPIPIP